jgi:hypothetical protein
MWRLLLSIVFLFGLLSSAYKGVSRTGLFCLFLCCWAAKGPARSTSATGAKIKCISLMLRIWNEKNSPLWLWNFLLWSASLALAGTDQCGNSIRGGDWLGGSTLAAARDLNYFIKATRASGERRLLMCAFCCESAAVEGEKIIFERQRCISPHPIAREIHSLT